MSIDAVNSTQSGSTVTRALFQKLKQNQNISKDDLTQAQAALAQTGADSKKIDSLLDNYDKIDTNGDGISLSELQTYDRTKMIKGQAEGRGSPPALTKEQMEEMAANSPDSDDGMAAAFKEVLANFDTADTDKDGKVSFEEFQKYAEDHNLQIKAPGKDGAKPGGPEGPPPPPLESQIDVEA